MKTLITFITLSALPSMASAASSTTTYSSGILVFGFIALCALIVVVQMIPAIVMVACALKALLSSKEKPVQAKARF